MASTTNNSHMTGDDLSKSTDQSLPQPTTNGSSNTLKSSNLFPATLALHADDPLNVVADVAPPIHVSTTFRYSKDPTQLRPIHLRPAPIFESTEHCYSRHTTHSTSRFEAILESLLKSPCLTYSSGLSAYHGLLTAVNPKTVSIGAGYHGCHGTLEIHQRLTGCKIVGLDCAPEELNEGDLVCLETPINPTGLAFDIAAHAEKAHSRGAYLMVDSTFGPPPLQDPFKWGADFVMHSGTKYIGGHSDLLCGVMATRDPKWLQKLTEDRLCLGNVMGGLEGWLGVRSLRTLELRVMRQSENVGRIVEALDGALTGHTVGTGLSQSDADVVKKCVAEVLHASLQKEEWLNKQMPNGFGPVFSLRLVNEEVAKRLPSKLELFHHATSLGGVESLIEWRIMTDDTVGPDLCRVSIGVEDGRDLLEDLLAGFRALVEEGWHEK